MSNISQIQLTVPPTVQTTSSEPAEKDVDVRSTSFTFLYSLTVRYIVSCSSSSE